MASAEDPVVATNDAYLSTYDFRLKGPDGTVYPLSEQSPIASQPRFYSGVSDLPGGRIQVASPGTGRPFARVDRKMRQPTERLCQVTPVAFSRSRGLLADSDQRSATPGLVETRIGVQAVVLLATAAVLLVLASFGFEVIRHGLQLDFRGLDSLQGYFDLDRESNIPAWFQSALLLLCTLLLWTAGDDDARRGEGRVRSWRILAAVFAYLSVDEIAMLHERADEPLHRLFNTSGFLLWAWVLLAAPLVLIFAVAYLPFLFSLPRTTRNGFLLAGALYVGGAIVVEMVGSYLFTLGGLESLAYQLSATVEEGLEMAGLLVLIATLGRHAASRGTPSPGAGIGVRDGVATSAAEGPQVVLRPGQQ